MSETVVRAAVQGHLRHRRSCRCKEQRELEALPIEIESLEAEEQALNARIAGPEFYKEGHEAIDAALARLAAVTRQLGDAYTRWHELESRSS